MRTTVAINTQRTALHSSDEISDDGDPVCQHAHSVVLWHELQLHCKQQNGLESGVWKKEEEGVGE